MIRVLLILAWRFCSGRELDGDRRTNATWRLPAGGAQAVLVRGGRTSWWVHQSLRYRAAVRLAALAVLVVFWWGMVHDPAVTMLLAQVVVGLAVLAGLRAVAYRVAERPHHRRLWRLHRALAPQVGWPVAGRRPGSWLTVPWDFLDDPDAQIRVRLPAGYIHTGKKAEEVERTVAAVLGVPDPDFADDYERRAPVLYMGRLAPPPELLPLAEVTDLLGEATDGEPLLGLAARDDPVVVNLDSESPHVAISAGTGAGKSVLLMGMAAQELRHGANLLIFDIKRTSHLWAVGLPGVVYCRTPEQIHIALVALGEEVDRRYRLIEAAADLSGNVDPTIVGPRLLILAEELNATMAALHAYWMSIRPPGSPPSPALLAWNKLLYMGRAGRMHVLGVAQRLSARAGGGGDARENFGTRCLARATASSWRMLAPEIVPSPPPSQIPGRLHVVAAGLAVETQAVLWTPREARDWACAGWQVVPEPGTEPRTEPGTATADTTREQRILTAVPALLALPPAAVLVTLREAARDGGLSHAFTVEALRKRAQRDPGFPPKRGTRLGRGGMSHTYDLAELRSWAAAL